jgi:hypothetical protein
LISDNRDVNVQDESQIRKEMTMRRDGQSGQQVTTRTLLRLCATFEGVTGIALMTEPDFIVRELFGGGLSGDIAIARATGLCSFFLGLACWPIGDDIAGQVIWAQLAFNSSPRFYLGYLKRAGGVCQRPPVAGVCSLRGDSPADGGPGI